MTNSPTFWSVTIRAICQQGLVQSRARGVLVTSNIPPKIHVPATPFQSVAVAPLLGNWIATVLPGGMKLARRLKRIFSLARRVGPGFSQYEGHRRLICKIGRPQPTAAKWFSAFLRPLLQFCQEPGSGLTHRFEVSEVLSSVSTSHAHKKAWSYEHGAQRNSASRAIGVEGHE